MPEYVENAFVVRLASAFRDESAEAVLHFDTDVTGVEFVDLAEQPIGAVPSFADHTVTLPMEPGQTVTLLVRR